MAIIVSSGVVSSGVNLSHNAMYVYGTVVDAVVNAHGSLDVFGGGSAAGTVVNSNGYLYVDGGKVSDSVIQANGSLVVGEFGSALNTTINDGAFCEVTDGATVNGINVSGTGSLTVSNGAVVTGLAFGTAANVTVLAGGSAQVIFNPWGGTVNAEAGATVEYLKAENAGYVGNSSDGLIEMVSNFAGYTVASGNSALIFAGFTADGAIVGNGAYFYVNTGAVAKNTQVLNGGNLVVSEGGAADGANLLNGGVMTVDKAEVANTKISAGGKLSLVNGAVANSTTLLAGAVAGFSAGAVLKNTVVNAGAELQASAGAVVDGVEVASGAVFTVAPGTSATGVAVAQGAVFNVNLTSDTYIKGTYDGEAFEIKNSTVNGCGIFDGFNCYVASGNAVADAVVSGGGNLAVAGGSASNITLAGGAEAAMLGVVENGIVSSVTVGKNGSLQVASATASSVVVNNSGAVVVFDDGLVADVTVNNGGTITVNNGGLLSGVLVNSNGTLTVAAGGIAEEVSVNSFAKLYVLSGGSASIAFSPWQDAVTSQAGAIITYLGTGSGVYVGNGVSGIVSKSDVIDDCIVTSGLSANVYVGGVMNNATVNNKGVVNVFDGGVVSGVNVKTGANIYIDNGGTVIDAVVNSRGVITVSNGALLAGGVVSSGGSVTILTGGVAENLAVDPMGYLTVSSGASASILFNPWQNNVNVIEGGILSVIGSGSGVYVGNETQGVTQTGSKLYDINIASGMFANVYTDGLAVRFVVDAKGEMNVSAGGVASNTEVNSGGILGVYESGKAYLTNVNSGAVLNVSNGGYTYATNVKSGATVSLFDGAVASNNTLSGTAKVSSGGSFVDGAIYGTIISGAITDGVLNIYEGGYAGGNISVQSGKVNVSSGGSLGTANTTQKITLSNGALMNVSSGAALKNVAIQSGAVANYALGTTAEATEVFSGGALTVRDSVLSNTTIHSGAQVNGLDVQYKTFTSGVEVIDSNNVSMFHSALEGRNYQLLISNAYVDDQGRAYLYNNQLARDTVVDPNARMTVNYGGMAINTHVNSAGLFFIKSSGFAGSTTLHSGGQMIVSKGGSVYDVDVRRTAAIIIQEGGSAQNVTLDKFNMYTVSTGLNATIQVLEPGGVLLASSGYSLLNVSARTGAIVNFLATAKDGRIVASGTDDKLYKTYGDYDIHLGSVEAHAISAAVYANQTAEDVLVGGNTGLTVYNGSAGTKQGYVGSAQADSNGIIWASGGEIGEVKLTTSMGLQVMTWSVKVGDKTVTMASGWLAPTSNNYSYTHLKDVTPNASSPTIVRYPIVEGLFTGTVAEQLVPILNTCNLDRGEKIERELVDEGGYIAQLHITSGGYVSSLNADAFSETTVSSGGVLCNTTLSGYAFKEAGFFDSYADASLYNVPWGYAGGSLTLLSGAVHSGKLDNHAVWIDGINHSGAEVYVEKGAILDFTVADIDPYENPNTGGGNGGIGLPVFPGGGEEELVPNPEIEFVTDALVTDLGAINNVLDLQYTITVNADQAVGEYFLAANMPDFARIYASIGDGDAEYGVVISEGASVVYQGREYQLLVYDIDGFEIEQIDGGSRETKDLVLSVKESGNVAPVINGEIKQALSENGRAVTLTIDAVDPDNDALVYEYKIDDGAWITMDGTSVTVNENGTVYFRVSDTAHYVTTTSTEVTAIVKTQTSDLVGNGYSQVLAYDAATGKVGRVDTGVTSGSKWKGVWEWSGKDIALWEVAGTGYFKGSKADHDGILLYNRKGHTFAVWSDITKGNYGYFELGHVDDNFSTVSVSNIDGNAWDDVLIRDDEGNFGVMLDGVTYRDICHGNPTWELIGAAALDNSGRESLLVMNTETGHLYAWNDADGDLSTWDWKTSVIAHISDGWEFAVSGDFSGDGLDDIVVLNTENGQLWLWEDGKVSDKRWIGTLNAAESWGDVEGLGDANGWEVAGVGDYNDDGKEDILLRECVTGWGGLGYWGAGYAGNWVDLRARVENNSTSNFAVIA
ncbi:MAG: hypothetical protein E7045_04160 [Lentisphaerae bacterium]|nr:hypothetical protein [Lentisphaerota bacterium]